MNVLEAVRTACPGARFYQASSSEMYGLIQVLAHELALHEETAVEDIIKAAQSKAREGLAMSPTRRYGENNA